MSRAPKRRIRPLVAVVAILAAGTLLQLGAGPAATATGGALTSGQVAPSLRPSTPLQVAEAVRVGPGAMPSFDPRALDDRQVDSVAAYVG
ncbi:MAG TPA: cytochrome c, partial [Actinomycetes bacterium]|nr:cytochrome c [Actinomycetes bacterium]